MKKRYSQEQIIYAFTHSGRGPCVNIGKGLHVADLVYTIGHEFCLD